MAVLVLCVGCSAKPEPEPEPKPEPEGLTGTLGGLADRAKTFGGAASDTAKELGTEVAATAAVVSDEVVARAKQAAAKAGEITAEALVSGQLLKQELNGKLAFAKLDYDLTMETKTESEADHAARIAGMKQLKIGSYTVGVAHDSKHPLGTVYKWQFRITWRLLTGRAVQLSLFTNHELADLELTTALLTIVPAVERVLGR